MKPPLSFKNRSLRNLGVPTLIIALTASSFVAQSAKAADGTWINAATGGVWSVGTNWSGGTIADGVDATANFSTVELTANNTVTLDSARTLGNLIFGDVTPSNNWTVSGAGVLTLQTTTGTPTITVNNQTASITSVITGTQGLTKAGAGTLLLNAVNTFTGNVNLNAGTLAIGNSAGAGSSANTILAVTGTTISGTSTLGSNTVAAAITLTGANANVTLINNNASGGFSSIITGSVDQTLTITNAGGTVVNLNSAASQFTNFFGTVSVNSGATLGFRATTSLNNGGTNALFDVNGTISTRNGGTLNLGALTGSGTLSQGLSNAGSTLIYNIGARNTSATFSGVIQNGDATRLVRVTKVGTATQTLSGTNTYTGTTTVTGGTLAIASTGSLAATAVTVQTGATFTNNGIVGGTVTVNSGGTLNGSGTFNALTTVNGALNPGNSPGQQTYTSGLTLGAGATTTLEIAGVGAAGTAYDNINVSGGTLTYGGTLNIVEFGGFDASITAAYNLFDGTVAGDFVAVNAFGNALTNSGGTWTGTSVGGTTYTFTQSDGILNVVAVPEPSALLLGGIGALALLRRRRAA